MIKFKICLPIWLVKHILAGNILNLSATLAGNIFELCYALVAVTPVTVTVTCLVTRRCSRGQTAGHGEDKFRAAVAQR